MGKNDYVGMDFVGVRAHESATRATYDEENFGKKQKGQYSHNQIACQPSLGLLTLNALAAPNRIIVPEPAE